MNTRFMAVGDVKKRRDGQFLGELNQALTNGAYQLFRQHNFDDNTARRLAPVFGAYAANQAGAVMNGDVGIEDLPVPMRGFVAYLLSKLTQLDDDQVTALFNKTLRAIDATGYIARTANAVSTLEMFREDLNRGISLGNIANAKLDEDQILIVDKIRVRYGTYNPALSGEEAQLGSVEWGVKEITTVLDAVGPPAFGTAFVTGWFLPSGFKNGRFRMDVGQRRLFFEEPLSRFDNEGEDAPFGLWQLDAPFIMQGGSRLSWFNEFGAALPANSAIRVEFIGGTLMPS